MIEVSGVGHSFGDVSVLDGVDLRVESGEFVALVGPNGAGKTTLLRTINGLVDPDVGHVSVAGTDVADLSAKEVSRQVATVPQDTHVGFSFSAEQVVEMGRTPHRSRLDWSDDAGAVERALERTGILDLRDRAVDDLSGGERQRVLLARALAQEPDALLLDEPTASLDINHQIQVLGLVEDLVADGQTAVAAIHDLDLAARFCDRLLLLADGEIRANGPPETVLADPALESAFGTRTAVASNPVTGTPTIAAVEEASEAGRVHVAGGGRGARDAVRALWRAGFEVSLGPAPDGDVAPRLAEQLGCETVTAPAFRTPGERPRRRALEACRDGDVLVDPGGPGSGALADEPDTPPRIRATLADPAESTRPASRALGDGGTSGVETADSNGGTADSHSGSDGTAPVRVVESEAELVAAVREVVDGSRSTSAREKRGE